MQATFTTKAQRTDGAEEAHTRESKIRIAARSTRRREISIAEGNANVCTDESATLSSRSRKDSRRGVWKEEGEVRKKKQNIRRCLRTESQEELLVRKHIRPRCCCKEGLGKTPQETRTEIEARERPGHSWWRTNFLDGCKSSTVLAEDSTIKAQQFYGDQSS